MAALVVVSKLNCIAFDAINILSLLYTLAYL
jgi:hypothetical protein